MEVLVSGPRWVRLVNAKRSSNDELNHPESFHRSAQALAQEYQMDRSLAMACPWKQICKNQKVYPGPAPCGPDPIKTHTASYSKETKGYVFGQGLCAVPILQIMSYAERNYFILRFEDAQSSSKLHTAPLPTNIFHQSFILTALFPVVRGLCCRN